MLHDVTRVRFNKNTRGVPPEGILVQYNYEFRLWVRLQTAKISVMLGFRVVVISEDK